MHAVFARPVSTLLTYSPLDSLTHSLTHPLTHPPTPPSTPPLYDNTLTGHCSQVFSMALPSRHVFHGLSCYHVLHLNLQQLVCLSTQEATEAGALAISWKKKAHDVAQKVCH